MVTVLAVGLRPEDVPTLAPEDVLARLGGVPADAAHCARLALDALCAACADAAVTRPPPTPEEEKDQDPRLAEVRARITRRLAVIDRKILVLSGKGGVGKSTVAVNLAATLRRRGCSVGLLDIDVHGPSVPRMLGIEDASVGKSEAHQGDGDETEGGMAPVVVDGIEVMSIGLLLQPRNAAVIWRGPRKTALIRQFLGDVAWGPLDYLVVDLPPGTGDEALSICKLLGAADGAVVVTTPQRVANDAVRRSIEFCRKLAVPVLGVVENMNSFVCPHCGGITDFRPLGGGRRMAQEMGVPFLGELPFDPDIAEACDGGVPFLSAFPDSNAATRLRETLLPVAELSGPIWRPMVHPRPSAA